MQEHEQSPEIAKERIAHIIDLDIGAYPKAEMILIILGLKPATELDLAPWNDPPEKIEQALKQAGIPFEKTDAKKEGWTQFALAAKSQDVKALAAIDSSKDYLEYGRLMGFPQTAIDAFVNETTLSSEEETGEPTVFAIKFSKEHEQEERAQILKWDKALKEFAPQVYNELKGED